MARLDGDMALAVERAADERAATTFGRAATARALAIAALATLAAPMAQRPPAALSMQATAVPTRVAALLEPPIRSRRRLVAAFVALIAGAIVLDAIVGEQLETLFDLMIGLT